MTALIFGVAGQTGSYLCELLIAGGEVVYGVGRTTIPYKFSKHPNFHLVSGDILKLDIKDILNYSKADVIYNFASLSSVQKCEISPDLSLEINFNFVLKLLSAIRENEMKQIKVIQASSSEMYAGHGNTPYINEVSSLMPLSIYGTHKAKSHELINRFREKYQMNLSSLIYFNHESPRRKRDFVTRKITSGLFEIFQGRKGLIKLGNLDIVRDWGYAAEYAAAAAKIYLNGTYPGEDYVIASGVGHPISYFLQCASDYFRLGDAMQYVQTDPDLLRKRENNAVLGNSSKIFHHHGWQAKLRLIQIANLMCAAEIEGEEEQEHSVTRLS